LQRHIHDLVAELEENSPHLHEVCELLRLNQSIGEAMDDVNTGRDYSADQFMKTVEQRRPRKNPA